MFNSKLYKQRARASLKGRWESVLIVTFIVLLLEVSVNAKNLAEWVKNSDYSFSEGSSSHFSLLSASSLSSGAGFDFIIMAAVYFILGSLAIAESYFYLKLASSRHKLGLSVFIEGFSLWSKGFLARIWSKLWVFLWSLLFIIPGIVKLFAYSQMNFLLAEYPELGVGKAMQISVVITRGYKGNLFMLSLSFILWDILSLFTAGLLQFWIRPYKKMTYVNAYHFLVERALKNGSLVPEDFYK